VTHNPKINGSPTSHSVSFVWKTFPSRDNQPYDFYLEDPVDPAGWLRGDVTPDGKPNTLWDETTYMEQFSVGTGG